LSATVSVLPAASSAARPLVFRNARVCDGARAIPQADVLVRDGRSYTVLIFAQSFGYQPAQQTFTAGAEWTPFTFPLKSFNGTDGHDLMGVFLGSSPTPGKLDLPIDDGRIEWPR
jgi:hypothetical protein